MEPTLREARYGDIDAIADVKHRNGLLVEPWPWLWHENPALAYSSTPVPPGWVLELKGRLVGYLGNVPLLYRFGGKPLVAAAARGFAVDPEFRSHSIRLAATFLSQNNVQLLLNTSANLPTSKIFALLKARKIPQPDYDQALIWVIDRAGFLASYLRKQGRLRSLAAIAGRVLAPVLAAEMRFRCRRPPPRSEAIEVEPVESGSIGEKFDDFWNRTQAARPTCMLADRSAAVLRWHLGHPAAAARQARVLAARRGGRLAGYAVLTREDSPDIRLKRSRVTDLMTENDDPRLIDALLASAFEQARHDRTHALEMIGFPAAVRERFLAANPYIHQLPSWQFWYKPVNLELAATLSGASSWYGCSFDGDASL